MAAMLYSREASGFQRLMSLTSFQIVNIRFEEGGYFNSNRCAE